MYHVCIIWASLKAHTTATRKNPTENTLKLDAVIHSMHVLFCVISF